MCAPFESTRALSVASRFPLCIQYVTTKFIYLSFVIDLIKRDHGISGPQPLTQQHIEFTSAFEIFKFIALLYKIINERFRRGIRVLESTKNTAELAKWENANIDFICFANKGVNHRHRKSHQVFLATPLGLFSNLPGPLPITSCVKTYQTCEVKLWWLLLLADIFRRQNVKSSVYVTVSLSHDEKMKKRRGPALKFRQTKIQSKNQLNQQCLR